MTTTIIPEFKCECGYVINTSSPASGEAVPKPGDISLCLNCARIHIFSDTLLLKKPTGKEMDDLKKSDIWPELQNDQMRIYKLVKKSLIK